MLFDPAELLATSDGWHSDTKTDLHEDGSVSFGADRPGKFVTSSMECLARLEQFIYRIRLPECRQAARVVKRAHARIGFPDRPGIYERAPSTGVPGASRLEEALLPVQLAARLLQ